MVRFPATILAVDDGSRESDLALDTAVHIALGTGSALSVVHVKSLDPSVVGTTVTPVSMDRLREEGQRLLDQRTAMLEQRGVQIDHALLRLGRKIEDTVLTAAADIGAGMLVVAVRGGSAGRRVALGDVSVSLVREAPCTVLAVRGEPGDAHDHEHRDTPPQAG